MWIDFCVIYFRLCLNVVLSKFSVCYFKRKCVGTSLEVSSLQWLTLKLTGWSPLESGSHFCQHPSNCILPNYDCYLWRAENFSLANVKQEFMAHTWGEKSEFNVYIFHYWVFSSMVRYLQIYKFARLQIFLYVSCFIISVIR